MTGRPRLQAEAAAESDALFSAILDRAFTQKSLRSRNGWKLETSSLFSVEWVGSLEAGRLKDYFMNCQVLAGGGPCRGLALGSRILGRPPAPQPARGGAASAKTAC